MPRHDPAPRLRQDPAPRLRQDPLRGYAKTRSAAAGHGRARR